MKTLGLLLYALVTSTAPLVAQNPTDQPRQAQVDVFQRAVDRAHASGRYDFRVLVGYMDVADTDLVVSDQTARETVKYLEQLGFKQVVPDYKNLGLPADYDLHRDPSLLHAWATETADGIPITVTVFVSAVSWSHARNTGELIKEQEAQSRAGTAFLEYALSGQSTDPNQGANGVFYEGHYRYGYGYDTGPAKRLPENEQSFAIPWYENHKDEGQKRLASAIEASKALPSFIGCFACSTLDASTKTIQNAVRHSSGGEGVFIGTTERVDLLDEPGELAGTIRGIMERTGPRTLPRKDRKPPKRELLEVKGYRSQARVP